VRTTLNLDDHLMRQAKELALRTDRTLSAVIEDALRETIYRKPAPQTPFPIPSLDFHFPEGVDFSDNEARRDWEEQLDAQERAARLGESGSGEIRA
jgi:hypothetical protein